MFILFSTNILSQAIREEERKKKANDSTSAEGQDELTIYLRQPTTAPQTASVRRFTKLGKKSGDEDRVSDKIEIDSDNIETPPATRRLFSPPREVKPVEKEPCKRERCSNLIQGRETKIGTTKPGSTTADLGSGKC